MQKIKMNIADAISTAVKDSLSAELSAQDVYSMLEYPPDTSMGDIALPCFKLSKALKKAPQVSSHLRHNQT